VIRFLDGPARECLNLCLKRAPRFLRVVFDPHGGGKWDALDQVDDAPTAAEQVCAYEIVGEATPCHVRRQCGGGFYMMASYRFLTDQPADAAMRSIEPWRAWCEERAKGQPV
jgi:hypothetical protein